MSKLSSLVILLVLSLGASTAQGQDIVKIIDDLTIEWDGKAEKLKAYDGLGHLCREKVDRDATIKLLKDIHHYDSVLYNIVTTKYSKSKDAEAQKTLQDIQTLEADYTTKSFLRFIHKECGQFNEIENNYGKKGGAEYQKAIKVLEKELGKYVKAITKQIDIIDEHVHHLRKL